MRPSQQRRALNGGTMQITLGDKTVTLRAGEKLIWQGGPVQGVLRNPLHIGFGVLFIALGVWAVITLGWQGALPGAPLVLVGVYFAYFHAFTEEKRRAETTYALTNQRALLAYSLRVLAVPIEGGTEIELKKGRFDTIIISPRRENRLSQGAGMRKVGFGHLESGDDLFKLIQRVKAGDSNGA